MTCIIHRSTELPGLGYQQRGSTPRKPVRWSVNYLISTPDGRTLIENTRVIARADIHQLLEVMGAYIDLIAKEAGYLATRVSWTAFSNGGTKKNRKGGKR